MYKKSELANWEKWALCNLILNQARTVKGVPLVHPMSNPYISTPIVKKACKNLIKEKEKIYG